MRYCDLDNTSIRPRFKTRFNMQLWQWNDRRTVLKPKSQFWLCAFFAIFLLVRGIDTGWEQNNPESSVRGAFQRGAAQGIVAVQMPSGRLGSRGSADSTSGWRVNED